MVFLMFQQKIIRKIQKITITNDNNRLSKEDIERMVEEEKNSKMMIN